MTMAVCTNCGDIKWGALTRCTRCGFEPTEETDVAKAMVLTDHFLSQEELERIGSRLKSGETYDYPAGAIEEFVQEIRRNPPETAVRRRLFGCVIRGLILAFAVGALIWLVMSLLGSRQ
jgi:hypothetical protein